MSGGFTVVALIASLMLSFVRVGDIFMVLKIVIAFLFYRLKNGIWRLIEPVTVLTHFLIL